MLTRFWTLSCDSHTEPDADNLGHRGGRKIRECARAEIFHLNICRMFQLIFVQKISLSLEGPSGADWN
jgi:hypothetical protein